MSTGSKLSGSDRAVNARAANLARRGTITANNAVGAVYYCRSKENTPRIITARIAGTFTGTIAVQIADPEEEANVSTNWVTIASYTAPTSQLVSIASDSNLRVYSTAWTSGTATVSLS